MNFSLLLTHLDPAGSQTHISLEVNNITSTFYLPNSSTSDLSVTCAQDLDHSNIRLDVDQDYCLLSVYSDDPQPTFVLGSYEVQMPISTTTHQKSIIITEDDQIATPAGRWQIEYDIPEVFETMLPPPILQYGEIEDAATYVDLVPSKEGDVLVDRYQSADARVQDQLASVPIVEIMLSPRFSATPDEEVVDDSNDILSQPPVTTNLDGQIPNYKCAENELVQHIDMKTADVSRSVNIEDSIPTDRTKTVVQIDRASIAEITNASESTNAAENRGSENPTTIRESEQHLIDTPRQPRSKAVTESMKSNTPAPNIANVVSTVSDKQPAHTTIVRLNEVSTMPTSENEEEEEDDSDVIESEDESQQQRDLRVPKRRLYEIEHENSPLQHKRQRIEDVKNSSMRTNHTVSFQEPQDTITVNTASTQTSLVAGETSDVLHNASKEISKTSTAQSKSKARSGLSTLKQDGVTKAARRRSLRRTPETYSSITSTYATESGFGRPTVIFGSTSQIPKDKTMMAIIEKLGGTVVTDIHNADVLCIGTGAMKKTSKFIIAIATGKDVVTDDWVRQALMDQKFPDRESFLPQDVEREKEWGFSMSEAQKRGKHGLKLLENVNVYMTNQLRKDLGNLNKELKQIALCLGATSVRSGLPKKRSGETVLVIGSTKNVDPEAAMVGRLGYDLYGQDVLTMGVLRGHIDLSSKEFMIEIPVKDEPGSE